MRSGDRSDEPKLAGAARLWATPVARDDQKSPEAHLATKARMGGGRTAATSLTVQAKVWPTPQAADGHKIGAMSPETATRQAAKGHQEMLAGAVVLWPTPVARNAKGRAGSNRNSPELPDLVQHGHPGATTPTGGGNGSPKVDLNPRFVESLMGLPPGWLTPSTSVETGSFLWWLHTHSLSSPTASASTSGGAE